MQRRRNEGVAVATSIDDNAALNEKIEPSQYNQNRLIFTVLGAT